MLLEGLFLPLTTPFYPDGRLYLRKLEHNVQRYSLTPAAGLAVLCAGGEAERLSDEETREVLVAAAGSCAPEKVLIAGVARESVRGALTFAGMAAEAGYDVVVVRASDVLLREFDNRTRQELLLFFHAVADSSPLPVVAAGCNGRELPLDLIAELAQHPQIVGAVESAGSPDRIQAIHAATADVRRETTVTPMFAAVTGRMLRAKAGAASGGSYIAAADLGGGTALATAPPQPALRTRTKQVGFQILAGGGGVMLESLHAGAQALMPPLAASVPQGCYEVVAAWKDGDPALAREKQDRLQAPAELLEERLGVPGIKYGCDLNGYFGGSPRLPGVPLTGAEKEAVERLLKPLRG